MKLSKSITLTVSVQIIQFMFSLVGGILIARLLGPSGKGQLTLVITGYSLGIVIAGMGMPVFNAYAAGKEKYSLRNIFFVPTLITLCIWSVSIIFFAVCYINRSKFSNNIDWGLIALIFTVLPVGLCTQNLLGILQGIDRIDLYNLVPIVTAVVYMFSIIILVMILKLHLNGALIGWVSSLVVGLVISWYSFWAITSHPSYESKINIVKGAISYGPKIWAGQVVGLMNFRLVLFLVGYYLGVAAVGYYALALFFAELLYYIPSAIGISSVPKLAKASPAEAVRITATGSRYALFCGLLGSIGLAISGRFVIKTLYSDAFLPAVEPILFLLPGVTVYSIAHVTTAYFNAAIGRPLINTAVAAISLVSSTSLMLLLIPTWGLRGAAFAATVGYIIAMAVNMAVFCKLSRLPLAEIILFKPDDLHSIMLWLRNSLSVVFCALSRITRDVGNPK